MFVATSIYVIWDPAGTPLVDGFQGRYLLPLAAAAMLVIRRRGRRPIDGRWPAAAMVAMAGYTVVAVVRRYYAVG